MTQPSIAEGIKKLDKIEKDNSGDNETIHWAADHVLLEFVPPEIKSRYDKLHDDVGFWYA